MWVMFAAGAVITSYAWLTRRSCRFALAERPNDEAARVGLAIARWLYPIGLAVLGVGSVIVVVGLAVAVVR